MNAVMILAVVRSVFSVGRLGRLYTDNANATVSCSSSKYN